MTSEQIKASQTGPEYSESYWLRELAYQLAVFNEMSAKRDEYNAQMDSDDATKRDARAELLRQTNQTVARIAAPFPAEASFIRPESISGGKK